MTALGTSIVMGITGAAQAAELLKESILGLTDLYS